VFLLGFAIGAWAGFRLGRHRSRTVLAEPAHQFTYTDPGSWRTVATVH